MLSCISRRPFRRAYLALILSAAALPSLKAAGDFTVSATPSSQTVNRGASTTYTVTVTKSGGFSGVVSFSTGQGATLIYPNDVRAPAKARFDFWNPCAHWIRYTSRNPKTLNASRDPA